MKNHIRIDTIKVFESDDIEFNKAKELLKTKDKATIYRRGIISINQTHDLHKQMRDQSLIIAIQGEKLDHLSSLIEKLLEDK